MAEVAEEFAASLGDLTVNSKPHINMLTMLAEDNQEYASQITQTVLNHLQQVNIDLIFLFFYRSCADMHKHPPHTNPQMQAFSNKLPDTVKLKIT